ncbi:MAG: phosphatase PAP2 family protein [Myxococcota bacterium]
MRGFAVSLAVVLLFAPTVRAEAPADQPSLDEALAAPAPAPVNYEPVGIPDYVTVGLGFGVSVLANSLKPRSMQPAALVDFDEAARDVVRLDSLSARYAIRDASDVTIALMMMGPLLGDALVTTAWYRRSPAAAFRMAIVDLEAFAITGALQGVTNVLVSRERPYGRTCGAETPADAHDCTSSVRYRSFFSGHSSFAFTGAALMCSQHLRFKLFGGGGAEIATCAVSFTVAASTALFRMMGDMHYATDVLTGAAVGTLVGFLVPAIHERVWGPPTEAPGFRVSLVPTGTGVSLMGVW